MNLSYLLSDPTRGECKRSNSFFVSLWNNHNDRYIITECRQVKLNAVRTTDMTFSTHLCAVSNRLKNRSNLVYLSIRRQILHGTLLPVHSTFFIHIYPFNFQFTACLFRKQAGQLYIPFVIFSFRLCSWYHSIYCCKFTLNHSI